MGSPIDALLTEVRLTDWGSWAIPIPGRLWAYNPLDVIPAFESITTVCDTESSWRTYCRLLDAFAHNHSGTPYPAMIPAVGLLVRMAPLVDDWQLRTVMEVLADCLGWSQGEPEFNGPDKAVHNMGLEVERSCSALTEFAKVLLSSAHQHVRDSANEFLECYAGIKEISDIQQSDGPLD